MRAIQDLGHRAIKFDVIICGSADAGEFNPYIVFQTQIRKGILIGLHEGYSVENMARSLSVSKEEVLSHLEFLRDAEFIVEKNGCIVPAFFVALREDVLRTKKTAKRLGEELAKCYVSRWDTVVETYHKLSVSSKFGFDRCLFIGYDGQICGRGKNYAKGTREESWKLLYVGCRERHGSSRSVWYA